jgi:hypothetical protein
MLQNEREKKQFQLCGLSRFLQPVARGFSLMEQDLEILIGASIMMLFTRLILNPRDTVIVVTYLFIWLTHKIGHILPSLTPHHSKRQSRYPVH